MLQIIEEKAAGKQLPYEIMSDSEDNKLIRFLVHFLFVRHTSR